MRLFLVSRLLVFISVLSLTTAQTTTAQTIITAAKTPSTTSKTPPTATMTLAPTTAPTTTTSALTATPTTTTTTSAPTATPTTTSPVTATTSVTTPPAATTSAPTTTSALTTTSAATTTTTLADPCHKYTVLDDPRRSPGNPYSSQYLSDYNVNWVGWYRLFINGQSAQMPDTCVAWYSCGTYVPLWLSGGHPKVEDGVVTRSVCNSWNNVCCYTQSTSISVKACPGGYYVYEFLRPLYYLSAYCAVVATTTTPTTARTSAPTTFAPITSSLTTSAPTTLAGRGIFYSFGSEARDTINPAADDGSSSDIQLSSPFLFFGRTYRQIYVNNNGYLTFNQPSSVYTPYSFPTNGSQDTIAGLWTNLDNRARGVVSYQQYTSGNVLTRATQDINTHFPNLTFTASWVFVATWNKVAYFNLTSTETSFQVVLISGSNISFILMNYGDIAVTGHPVQAGYDTINSTHYFVIPGSNSGSFISNLRNSSNVNVPGRWVFRVDTGPRNSILKYNVVGLRVKLTSFLDLMQSDNIEPVLQKMKQELLKYGLPNSIELKLRKLQKTKP